MRCPGCGGTVDQSTWRWCPECGALLPGAVPAPEAEEPEEPVGAGGAPTAA